MSIKIKVLKEEKRKIAENAKGVQNESVLSMLTDPTMLAVGAGGLMMLYQALFGKKPDPQADLERVKREIEAKIAKAEAGRAEYRAKKSASQARLKAKLDDLKKQRAMELPELPEVPEVPVDSAPSPSPKDIKKYIDLKAMALRKTTPEGERESAMRFLSKLEKQFPGIENHPDVLSAEKLNEIFSRFL